MKNRFLSLLCVLALCLGLLPVTALAVGGAPSQLYVGDQQVSSGNDITYWTTDESTGGLTKYEGNNDNWNVKYDQSTATLTLKNANISGSFHQYDNPYTAGIYAQGKSNQPVALTIELIGTNTITGTYGIFLNAEINASSYGTNATLTITGENNGSLGVSGSDHGIYVKSGTGNASLNIKDVAVTSSTNGSCAAGVYVMSSANATGSPNISLSVNGGNLTASGTGSSDGILFYVGSSQATGATTRLTVSENAIVDARNGGIKASDSSTSDLSDQIVVSSGDGTNGGIVFDGSAGTVYGDVTLDESLTINQGETLTVPSGAELNCNGKLTNNGTINVEDGGTVSGRLNDGTTLTTPSISQQPQSMTVTEGSTAEFSITASDAQTYQWQRKATDTGSEWEDISYATTASYTTAGTTTNMSGYQYRCVVTGSGGVSITSAAATLTVEAYTPPTTYTISADVDPVEAGTVSGGGSYAAGTSVTLTATPNSGYRFVGWVEDGTTVSTNTSYIFNADKNRSLTALFDRISSGGGDSDPTSCITLPSRNTGGELKLSGRYAEKGETVTLTAVPDEGYELDTLTVTDSKGNEIDLTDQGGNEYNFKMPAGRVTIDVTFRKTGTPLPFADVGETYWAYDEIAWAYENGYMSGTSATAFTPGGMVTRQQMWMILARMAGANPTDMAAAKAWAVANGISDGSNPGSPVTRQQLATLLYRYAVLYGYDVSVGESTNILSYADVGQLSEYAIPAMQWACGKGIIRGTGDGSTLTPQGQATRAQLAVMLYRFMGSM